MLIEKVLKNCLFVFLPAFGRILVLVAAIFLLHCQLKSIEKLLFSSFWQDLGFGG